MYNQQILQRIKQILLTTLAIALCSCGSAVLSPVSVTTPTIARITITVAPTASQHFDLTSRAKQADLDFQKLVERVKSGDPSVDFTDLRMAFVRTSMYD